MSFREPSLVMFFGLISINMHALIALERLRISALTTPNQRQIKSDFVKLIQIKFPTFQKKAKDTNAS